jgi:hypothetical protein
MESEAEGVDRAGVIDGMGRRGEMLTEERKNKRKVDCGCQSRDGRSKA